MLKDNELASGAILARHKNSIIYYVGASVIELNRKYGASNLLIWECILYSKKEGFSFFDLGGIPYNIKSDDPSFGVYRFKKGFGGLISKFFIGEKINSKLKYNIFKKILRNRNLVKFISRYVSF